MDVRAQVTEWVEKKVGRIIDEDLKIMVGREYSQFNVQSYVNSLEEKYFTKVELDDLKCILSNDFQPVINESDTSDSDNEENDSLEFDNQEYHIFSIDEAVKNLESESEDIKVKAFQALEIYGEELINHKSWTAVQETLLKILKDGQDRKMHTLVLKVFLKFLTCTNKPQIVCEGFMSVSKGLALLIKNDNVSYEEIHDLKIDKWLYKSSLNDEREYRSQKCQKPVDLEVPIRLMSLLIYCQQQMPEKWVRFNEKKLRKIIFSFIHLLSSTNSKENRNVTALELLSILNPTANWCSSWCHTAVGRNLLCCVLRKYKRFFTHMIEIILKKTQTRGLKPLQSVRSNEATVKNYSNKGKEILNSFPEKKPTGGEKHMKERTKHVRSAPVDSAESDGYLIFWTIDKSSKWLTESIPRRIVAEATFWHSVSVIVSLIQYRCGQALFPVQTATRKRSLSAQDLSLLLIEYFENMQYNECDEEGFGFSVAYRSEVLKKIEVLKSVRNYLLSKVERSPLILT